MDSDKRDTREIKLKNILSIDVEDWYHPEYVRNKVTDKIDRINYSFDITLNLIKKYGVSATFFVVGEIVEKHPEIVNEIYENGSEVAFHGYYHRPLWELDSESFTNEIKKFDSLVYSIIGEKSIGFRAPSYSLNNDTLWALDILEKESYIYDSSLFPVKTPLYGVSGAPLTPYKPSSKNIMEEDELRTLIEFPALIYDIFGLRIPAAGGFYLRLLPISLFEKAISQVNMKGFPAIITFHPWELDNKIPRLKLSPFRSLVTYYNIGSTKNKIEYLLSKYEFISFKDYIGDSA